MVIDIPISEDWNTYYQALVSKGVPLPDIDETKKPAGYEAIFEVCEKIKDRKFSLEEKKNLYCMFLVPLFIVRNEKFINHITYDDHNVEEDYFYLGGKKDRLNGLLRTQYGFSFMIASKIGNFKHATLMMPVNQFNEICKEILNDANKITAAFEIIKNIKLGPWHMRKEQFSEQFRKQFPKPEADQTPTNTPN